MNSSGYPTDLSKANRLLPIGIILVLYEKIKKEEVRLHLKSLKFFKKVSRSYILTKKQKLKLTILQNSRRETFRLESFLFYTPSTLYVTRQQVVVPVYA